MGLSAMAKSLRPSSSSGDASLAVTILFLILVLNSISSTSSLRILEDNSLMRNNQLMKNFPCEEIYVVREGETLHTISDKCGDPFIIEQNPHIHDSDDVFPGLVIKITPNPRKL